MTRPVVFFDIQIGDQNAGRVKMGECRRSMVLTPELFSDITPKYPLLEPF